MALMDKDKEKEEEKKEEEIVYKPPTIQVSWDEDGNPILDI